MKNINDVLKFFNDCVEGFTNDKCGTMYLELGNGLYLVVGYEEGFDVDDNPLNDGEYHLCTKIAYNCDDLQCDYDCDWYMPYDEDGCVWDTDMEFSNDMTTAKWYLNQYEEIMKAVEKMDLIKWWEE